MTTLYHDFDVRWEGRQEGKQEHLVTLVCRKLRKSKSTEVIAEELEEDIKVIEQICDIAKAYAPDYDEKAVCEAVANAIPIQ